jgi:hypothetical protein
MDKFELSKVRLGGEVFLFLFLQLSPGVAELLEKSKKIGVTVTNGFL